MNLSKDDDPDFSEPGLRAQVLGNCDIADARHALDDPLCIYLLKMRDLYRWEQGLDCTAPVDREALGNWVAECESRWDEIEELPYSPITVGSRSFDCFDSVAINEALVDTGLVYGAGQGLRGRPVFFLGRVVEQDRSESVQITISGDELARGVTAPPAWSRDNRILVRRDALRHYLAGVYEEWSWKKPDNVMARVMHHYGFHDDAEAALDRMLDDQVEVLVLHELGEVMAGELLGPDWQRMVASLDDPVEELKVRVIRDNLADSLSCLPGLLSQRNTLAIDFYYASMSALRQEMFPSFLAAYDSSLEENRLEAIRKVVVSGRDHWLRSARRLLAGTVSGGDDLSPTLASCIY